MSNKGLSGSASAVGTNCDRRLLRQRGAGKACSHNNEAEEGNGPLTKVILLADMSRNILQQDIAPSHCHKGDLGPVLRKLSKPVMFFFLDGPVDETAQ